MKSCFGVCLIALAGCGSNDGEPPSDPYAPIPIAGSRCGAVAQRHAVGVWDHVPQCSPITYASNPPSWGDHYDFWAAYGEFTTPVAHGFSVHNLEHGSVVVSHHCPDAGCDVDLEAARAWIRSLRVDDFCLAQGLGTPRVLLTPDPELDSPWAASAWGYTLRADCFEPAVFSDFYAAHVGRGPEDVCSAGTTEPPDCG
jgi:uncharacterized protein DUF3105